MAWFNADHNYAHHWSEHYLTDTTQFLPLKHIFADEHQSNHHCHGSIKSNIKDYKSDNGSAEDSDDDEIDVCSDDVNVAPIGSLSWQCAEQKARTQMNECERHVASFSKTTSKLADVDKETYWEDSINKSHWSHAESTLFDEALQILLDEKLARVAYKGSPNEIVLRRLSVDRSASRLRSVFQDISWQLKLSQWLHTMFMDNLPSSLLACYLDITQTLRSKVPTLVERVISRDVGNASERLSLLLKRPWDPAVTSVVSTGKQKPCQSILFVVVQCRATQSPLQMSSRRMRFWNTLLSQLGKVAQVVAPSDESIAAEEKSMEQFAQLVFKTVSGKVRELSARHPNRKVVLVGWHTTSIVNCQVALMEEVTAVVCLGFPIHTIFGRRGGIDDVLCDVTTPTLFVIGDRASFCDVNDLEDIRERTFSEAVTSSVVVGGADDWLRVSEEWKKRCVVTQPMVDRKILEEICDFLNTILSPPSDRDETHHAPPVEAHVNRKRPSHESRDNDAKRRRSSSPHVVLHRHSSTSAQINQLLSDQKRSTEQDGEPLHGLSFDLQTGSISGLTSARAPTPSNKRERSSLSTAKNKEEKQARSITIDLTQDPSDSPPTKPKSQLLHPTEKQTQAAIAAILGDDEVQEDLIEKPPVSDITDSSTAPPVTTTSTSSFDRSTSKVSISPTAIRKPSPLESKPKSDSVYSYTFDKKNIGSLTAQNASRTGFKPVRPGLDRFSSMDQSVTSRTRREDRETLQATAILEQLTSSLDADKGPGSRSASPEVFPEGFNMKRKAGLDRRSSDVFPQAATSSRVPRPGRVRTRGGQRGGSSKREGARKLNIAEIPQMNEKSGMRYVVASPRGGATSKRGKRRIALMPEFGSSLFGSVTKSLLVSSTSVRPVASAATKSAARIQRSASLLSDVVMSSYPPSKPTMEGRPKMALGTEAKLILQKGTAPSKPSHAALTSALSGANLVKSTSSKETIKHIVYLKEPGSKPMVGGAQQHTRPLVTGTAKTVAKLVTAKHGDRAMLSITRPRATSAGISKVPVTVIRSSSVSGSPVTSKSSPLGMPSLILTKVNEPSKPDLTGTSKSVL